MTWDDEADVVCVGPGVGALAVAIVTVDAGFDVFVATASAGRNPWTLADLTDPATTDYFRALSEGVDPQGPPDATVPFRAVAEAPPVMPRNPIEPFVGARLKDWAGRCLASPYGYLHTRIADRGKPMRGRGGEAVEIAVVGSLQPGPEAITGSQLRDWLLAEARERDIEISEDSSLHRIVFDEGDAVGAVLATPEGPYAVRARCGVTVSTWSHDIKPATASRALDAGETVQVCLVNKAASRFGRVELVVTHAPEPQTARDATESRSEAGRRRKGHRYPALGQ